MTNAILRLPQVKLISGLARSTIYARMAEGLLTRPVQIGGRAVGWPVNEIEALNAARIAGKNDDEIRQIVARLESERKSIFKRFSND
jgi:prophage regulatory protein